MDKLTFFSMKSPEKLDRIGEYLAQRLSRDVERQRKGYTSFFNDILDMPIDKCLLSNISILIILAKMM